MENIEDDRCSHKPPDPNEEGGLRMIEFFSGIGGMRYGVERALNRLNQGNDCNRRKHESQRFILKYCVAYEISQYANQTYEYCRQGESKRESFAVRTKLVEQLNACDLDGKADLWTM